MKIKVEGSPLKIGVDNAVTEAIQTGLWGIRISFCGSELNNRYEVVIPSDDALMLAQRIKKCNAEIEKLVRLQGLKNEN